MSGRRVLVTGANGYVGFAVARALRARGHLVYGLVRSQSSASLLEKHEITPIVSTLQEAPERVRQLGVSAIIETHKMTEDAPEVTSALLAALNADGRYLYTSGCLTYGNRPGEECLESDPVPPSRRADIENIVLAHAVCGTVLRPAFMFGGDGGNYASRYWTASQDGDVVIAGEPNKEWPWAHVDDVADAFALALVAPEEVVRGQVFNLSDGSKTIFSEIVTSMAEIHTQSKGLKIKVVPAETPFEQALDKSCFYKSEKALSVLGWTPTRVPFTKDLETYHRSWHADKN